MIFILKNKVTLKEIAKRAGISHSAASRAMADKYGVSPDVKRIVRNIALELGYVSKKTAGKSKFSKKVLLFLDRQILFFKDKNPFYEEILNAMEQQLLEAGIEIEIIIVKCESPEDIEYYALQNKNPAGIIFLSKNNISLINAVYKTGLPLILVDNWYYEGHEYDMIRTNNYCVGFDAANYLVSKGHKNVAFVGRIDFSVSFKERYRGFADCLKINGLNILHSDGQNDIFNNPVQCKIMEFNASYNAKRLESLLLSSECPSALFCANDPIAFMVLKQLSSMNIPVPEKISVIGCDNIAESESFKLTTFDVFTKSMGYYAATLLVDRINYPNRPPQYIQTSSKLIERATVRELKIT